MEFHDKRLSSDLQIEYYKKSILKIILYYFMIIITFGIFKYYFDSYKYWFFTKCNLEDADYLKINNTKRKETEFNELKKKKVRLLPHEEKVYLIHFFYKYQIYYFSHQDNCFMLIKNRLIDSINSKKQNIEMYKKGVDTVESSELLGSYGQNLIDVPNLSVFGLFFGQLFAPFTVYQLLCVILWNLNDYAIYGNILLVMALISITAQVYQVKKQNTKTRKMAYHEEIVSIQRNDQFVSISSLNLVIGDVIKIQGDKVVPCDILLIKGKCILKEAMLTGETEPIIKSPYNEHQDIQSNNIILAGTNCLLSKHEEGEAIGIVVNTGFYTFKGELVRSLLLGESEEFQFNVDVIYFLLAILSITFIGFVIYTYYVKNYASGLISDYALFLRGMEFFATAIPPTLPLCLTIGLEFAMERLKRYGIQTIIIGKINEAGRIKVMCFDKTGTLTENGLIFKGVMGKECSNDIYFGEILSHIDDLKNFYYEKKLLELMGCCHSLSYLGETIVGDPLEVEMFKNSGFEMFEDNLGNTFFTPNSILTQKYEKTKVKFLLVKKMDFTPDRKRYSCIIKEEYSNKYFLFTKGAPDVIKDLCDQETLPINFMKKLNHYSQKGLRILGLASKTLSQADLNLKDQELEKNLNFEGLLFFENPLKPVTANVISELKDNGIINVMITGDNLLTAFNVGLKCDIVSLESNIWTAKYVDEIVYFEKVQNNLNTKDTSLNKTQEMDFMSANQKLSNNFEYFNFDSSNENFIEKLHSLIKNCNTQNTKIILTGDAFEYLSETLRDQDLYDLIKNTLIFGRTNPNQKANIVKCYKEILNNEYKKNNQFFVGFCGDGANDCPALKSANVGLSLSDLEASIASPFTSTVTDISNVPNLLLEGKASLITGIQNFKYILCFALYQFYGMIFLFILGVDFASGQYYFIDLLTYFPVTIIMCMTYSKKKLVKDYPHCNLVNSEILLSIIGGNIIVFLGYFILLLYITHHPKYLSPYDMAIDFFEYTQDEFFFHFSYYLFFFNQIIALFAGIAFSIGAPYRLNWYQNIYYFYHFIFISFLCTLCFLVRTEYNYYITYFFNIWVRKLDYELTDLVFVIIFIYFFSIIVFFYERNVVKFLNRFFQK